LTAPLVAKLAPPNENVWLRPWLTVNLLDKQNEQQRNLKDLKKEKNNGNSFSKFYWLSSSAL